MKFLYSLVIFAVLSLLASSCSITRVFKEKPDYKNPRYVNSKIRRDNIYISEVIDKRFGKEKSSKNDTIPKTEVKKEKKNKSYQPGNVRRKEFDRTDCLGFFDNNGNDGYYYKFSDPLELFVQKSLNSSFSGSLNQDSVNKIPVTVVIDSFNVEDHGSPFRSEAFLNCSMTFSYKDTSGNRSVKTTFEDSFTSGGFILPRVQYLVYDGIYDCARQFVSEFDKSHNNENLSGHKVSSPASVADSLTDSSLFDYRNAVLSEFYPFYQFGSNIKGRIGIGYNIYKNDKDAYILSGGGFQVSFFVVKDGNKSVTFWGGNGCYSPLIFIDKSHEGLFFNPSVEVFFGREDFRFFIGPVIKEAVGFRSGSYSLKAGSYQLKVWGSKYLSSDLGFFIDLGFYSN